MSEKCDVSSSKKKIEKIKGYFDYEDNFSAESQSRFVIIDLNMLNDIFNNIAKCRYCDRLSALMLLKIKVVAEDLLAVYQQLASIVALVMAQ
ncbi:hypothetical protein TNCT_586571 [Trichonephila clavata]|nr:hypothetical protein TNCT_586571 [Trichonephila clavata]